ncbi:MAG: S-layer homology domain-containing protein [Clostridia bacterium]|nr:S-layer homology domain-containing protein [Clostridia bacterium]
MKNDPKRGLSRSILSFAAMLMLCIVPFTTVGASAASDTAGAAATNPSYIIPFTETPVAEVGTSATETTTVTPVIIKMGNTDQMKAQNAEFYIHKANTLTSGNFASVSEEGGASCVRLTYAKPTETFLPEYRIMPKYANNDKITAEHKYMRVTFKTEDTYPAELILLNNGNRTSYITLMSDCSVSKGEWIRTNAAYIVDYGCLERFLTSRHCTLGFFSDTVDSAYYISEIAFFGSEAQAYEYYGDSPRVDNADYTGMTFGGGNGTTYNGDTYGVHSFNKATQSLDITYAETTNVKGDNERDVGYLAKIKFTAGADYSPIQRYMRVYYSAKNPEGVTGASMYLWTDANHYTMKVVDDIKDTNGEFVLSDTVYLHEYAADRFSGTGKATSIMHNSLFVNTDKPGGLYSIKAVYFFDSREEAEAFTIDESKRIVTVNGTDISKYRVVVSADAPVQVTKAANTVVKRIQDLTGTVLPIVDDTTPVSEYEILIGVSTREKSKFSRYEAEITADAFASYVIEINGKDVVITSKLAAALEAAIDNFTRSDLYGASANPPGEITLSDAKRIGTDNSGIKTSLYIDKVYDNVEDPERFTDDFDADDGYFLEHNNTSDWKIENGVLSTDADERVITYLHVYEPDVTFAAKMKYSGAGSNGDIGLMLRYNSADAWVKAGYDFVRGEWYIENRQGYDFYLERNASKKATLSPDTWYELSFTVDNYTASLTVNGEVILTADGIGHKTPGKVAFFAEDVTATFDDADILLLSGEGTIIKNAHHTYLWDDRWVAGGTAFEMQDGLIRYVFRTDVNMKSYDGGLTWVDSESFTETYGEPNFIRLNDGDIIIVGPSGSNVISLVSSDDGKTFTKTGTVCKTPFNGDTTINATAVNMNDKIFQSPTTDRIFYCQNYETKTSDFDGKKVFCDFYYTDDKGKTWHKSETDSWEIEGNEKETYFGECKILECSDGTLRIYTSWNDYGCIVYSESTDNGVTWGPIVEMPEFYCQRSSMAFARDPYAENDHTYYMVWVYSIGDNYASAMPRSRLALAKTTDGKNWTYLGDLWRWESNYLATNVSAYINHIVNPFIYVNEKYVFCGSGTSERMADDPVSTPHQLQRQNIWTIDKSALPEGTMLNNFSDVSLSDDAYGAISYVTANGLFTGTSNTTFAPAERMTRSMFVTVLGRLDGVDPAKYITPTFRDVVRDQWYTSYVEWAAEKSIVNGIGGGLYGINESVTIEQACTILARYNGFKAGNATGKTAASFSDGANVSDWAKEGVEWAVANGIYEGDGGMLNPVAPATRAIVAVMFHNYVTIYGK